MVIVAAITGIFQELGTDIRESTYCLLAASDGSVGGISPCKVPPESVAIPSDKLLGGCITIGPERLTFRNEADESINGGTATFPPIVGLKLIIK